MRRNAWIVTIVLIVAVLGINNTVYYFVTKQSLEESLSHEMESIAKQIEISIEQSRLGSEKYQEQIGHRLRTAAIAVQYALDPDIEKVENAQLVELSKRLNVQHITLLKKTDDDIVLYKSSDPQQIGIGTRSWKPWYQAFNELFTNYNVNIAWGQSLQNFWTGPFEVATSDTSKVRKWGYYYDGTTNYIIDPYVSYEMQAEYEWLTGVDKQIDDTVKGNPSILEITVINPVTFPMEPLTTLTMQGEELMHITQKPIIYGSYDFSDPGDYESVRQAVETQSTVTLNTHINGKHVLKNFIPVPIEGVASMVDDQGIPLDYYLLAVVSDYQLVQNTLDSQFVNLGVIIATTSLFSIIVLMIFWGYYRRSRDKVVREAQVTYSDEISQLFHSIQAQRHDFVNHVQTIHSLAALNKVEELKKYTKDLTGEIRVVSDIINIGNPAIAALIRSKLSQAESMRICFECEFAGMRKLELGMKTLDLTRLLGNLVDNAFEEVMKYPEEQRWIQLSGTAEANQLRFTIANYCEQVQELRNRPIFEPGYSNKGKGHEGLGLSIVTNIIEQYKGTVRIDLETPNQLTIEIIIPH
ncbi:GHKL domain-containing protein [Paenibacillaceae bacterium]|nr:GHKL domain-containing protein [Paenibacillaceae bacterium]